MFAYNGGPGSASIWLHMGILGPRRVAVVDPGFTPPPPVSVVDNAYIFVRGLGPRLGLDPESLTKSKEPPLTCL